MKPFLRVAIFALLIGATGCGPDHPSRAQEGETCAWTPIGCGDRSVESCCAASQCAYRVSDGTDFPCDGQDCSAAANELVAYCES